MRRQNYVQTALLLDGDFWYLAGATTILEIYNTPFSIFWGSLCVFGAKDSDQLQYRVRARKRRRVYPGMTYHSPLYTWRDSTRYLQGSELVSPLRCSDCFGVLAKGQNPSREEWFWGRGKSFERSFQSRDLRQTRIPYGHIFIKYVSCLFTLRTKLPIPVFDSLNPRLLHQLQTTPPPPQCSVTPLSQPQKPPC